jgi:hypothetical protein
MKNLDIFSSARFIEQDEGNAMSGKNHKKIEHEGRIAFGTLKTVNDSGTHLPDQQEDITEHMTRSEMIADIMCMLADADIEKLRRVMDKVIQPKQ